MIALLLPLLASPSLVGCAWLTDEELDALGDGDGDDVPAWDDCDDDDASVGSEAPRFEDADADGIGGVAIVACPDVGVATDGDCDDAALAVHPDAVEDCDNGIDDDCDAAIDECALRDAGLVLTYGVEGGGLGGFPSIFMPTRKGSDDLVIARPYGHSVESYIGTDLPASGVHTLGGYDWQVQDGPLELGSSLAWGDLDADSVFDLVAGAASSTQPESGADEPKVVFLYGPVDALDSAVDRFIVAESDSSKFGHEVVIGDLDFDGVGDLAVAAPSGEDGCGAVYVAFGGPTFPESDQIKGYYNAPDLRGLKLYTNCDSDDGREQGGLGSALAGIPGGVNEELRGTILAVSDPYADGGRGSIYLWQHAIVPTEAPRTFDLSASPDVTTWTGVETGGLAGVSLASGDLQGDGLTDLATGALYAEEHGMVYVVYDVAASSGGLLAGADVELRGEPVEEGDSAATFGYSVAVVSDVNGDGYDELAVGAPRWSGALRREKTGAVYLFNGPLADGSLDAAEADRRLYGSYPDEECGSTLDGGGDLDGDGKGELLVGAEGWSPDGTAAVGAIIVLWGADW